MDWWMYARVAATGFLGRHALLAAAIVVSIEEAGVPLPMLPGDLVMLLLGVRARQGRVPLWLALVVLELATLVGATVLYVLCRTYGRGFVARYGRYLHLTPERLARVERWIERHGVTAVAAARLIPGLRIASVVGCGVLGVPPRIFLPGLAVGGFLYLLIYTLLGYFVGPAALRLVERVHIPGQLAGSLLGLAVVVVWLVRGRRALHRRKVAGAAAASHHGHHVRRRRRLRAGVGAGAVATGAAFLAANVLVLVAGQLGLDLVAPHELVVTTARRLAATTARAGDLVPLLLAVPLYAAIGVFWGAVYGERVEARLRRRGLPDWAAGLAFAPLPLLVALLVLLPLLGLGLPGSGAPLVLAVGETVRHAVYGLVLGLTYPVLLAPPEHATATPPPPVAPAADAPPAPPPRTPAASAAP